MPTLEEIAEMVAACPKEECPRCPDPPTYTFMIGLDGGIAADRELHGVIVPGVINAPGGGVCQMLQAQFEYVDTNDSGIGPPTRWSRYTEWSDLKSDPDCVPLPEPATYLSLGIGLVLLALLARRRGA